MTHTREENKEFYRQASNVWLESKIKREEESIRINQEIIEESRVDIEICKEILKERTND